MPLDDGNFEEIALKAYHNNGSPEEFQDDIKRIRYIKRLLNNYRETGQLQVQLVLNHLIVFFNVFQPQDAAARLIIYKSMKQLDLLKPFMVFLNLWPDEVVSIGLGRETLYGSDIPMETSVVELLRDHKVKMGYR